jgi:hypothetical protein
MFCSTNQTAKSLISFISEKKRQFLKIQILKLSWASKLFEPTL